MLKILSIGNSFSQDAHKWLPQIGAGYGHEIRGVNLFIGGCSLETHWQHFVSGARDYDLEINGAFSGKISLPEALRLEQWDVITFQQASHFSGEAATYYPYLIDLCREVRKICGSARIYMHETWAYEIDSAHGGFRQYGCSQRRMYEALKQAYQGAAEAIGCGIIPVGDVIQYLRENAPEFDYGRGGLYLTRDGFHLSWLYGRYAAALTWYATLCRGEIGEIPFLPTDNGETADRDLLRIIHNSVKKVLEAGN